MAEQTFNQTFQVYWRESNKSGIPKSSGIYCVYECTYNETQKTVSIHELIYIGEAANVNARISNHEKLSEWKKYVRKGNILCYNFSSVDSDYRERVEAAFIFHHKPPVNIEYKNNFPFDKTFVNCKGKHVLLKSSFIVNKTNN